MAADTNPPADDREPVREPDPDPEIEALLGFEPVPRKCPRRHGWKADNQRIHIAGLARTGDVELAADAAGLSGNGARQLRKCIGAGAFNAAWDKALDLHKARHPKRARAARPGATAAAPDGERRPGDPVYEGGPSAKEFVLLILEKYWLKIAAERAARLEGRIVEADFYVRQLSWFEVLVDLGECGMEAMDSFKRGGVTVTAITATPMSLLLDNTRRAYWREKGEPERPTLASLGLPSGEVSTGHPHEYSAVRDGDWTEWNRREEERAAVAAEAQRLWEEKARADAEAWAKREESSGEASDPEAQP